MRPLIGEDHVTVNDVNQSWNKGQVDPMDCKIKRATVNRFHHSSHDKLGTHLAVVLAIHQGVPLRPADI